MTILIPMEEEVLKDNLNYLLKPSMIKKKKDKELSMNFSNMI